MEFREDSKAAGCRVLLVTQNCVHLSVGVKPIDKTKPKIRRRKDLLPAASKENTRDLSQSSVSPNFTFKNNFIFVINKKI